MAGTTEATNNDVATAAIAEIAKEHSGQKGRRIQKHGNVQRTNFQKVNSYWRNINWKGGEFVRANRFTVVCEMVKVGEISCLRPVDHEFTAIDMWQNWVSNFARFDSRLTYDSFSVFQIDQLGEEGKLIRIPGPGYPRFDVFPKEAALAAAEYTLKKALKKVAKISGSEKSITVGEETASEADQFQFESGTYALLTIWRYKTEVTYSWSAYEPPKKALPAKPRLKKK